MPVVSVLSILNVMILQDLGFLFQYHKREEVFLVYRTNLIYSF